MRLPLSLLLGATLVYASAWGADASLGPEVRSEVPLPRTQAVDTSAPTERRVNRSAPFTRLEEQAVEESGLGDGLAAWQAAIPAIREVTVTSTVDGSEQFALMLPPTGRGPAPLLVVLHTWGGGYAQSLGIPFARFAAERGWALVQPHFRGPGNNPLAGGSPTAVQDVVDAIDEMVARPDVDARRVYVVGFSGGGHMGLLMAGRHPDKLAGVVTWAAIHDLVDWYRYVSEEEPSDVRRDELERVCQGNPLLDPIARGDCGERSPQTYLTAATRAGLPMYVAAGLEDTLVPPSHALEAYEQLTPAPDFLPEEIAQVRANVLPERLASIAAPTYFDPQRDPEVLFASSQGPATVVLFRGEHALLYNPGLAWLVDVDAEAQARAERREQLADLLVNRPNPDSLRDRLVGDPTTQAADEVAERVLRERSIEAPRAP